VLLVHLKKNHFINGKPLHLSLETDDPDTATRHMRWLVAMLRLQGRLRADSGAAKEFGAEGTGLSRLNDVITKIRRLGRVADAEYGSEALATAKRWGRPVGFIHCLTGRNPEVSAGTYRTRRMRRRKGGQRLPTTGDTWHLRCGRGQCFYLNGNVYNARIELAARQFTWPLTVPDRARARTTMAPVREAGARVRDAASKWKDHELGTAASIAAGAALQAACGLFAGALNAAGALPELVALATKPPAEVGTASLLPVGASTKSMNQANEKKVVDELVKMINDPEQKRVTVPELIAWAKREHGVSRRRFVGKGSCLDQARKKTGKPNWPPAGRPRR